VSENNLDSLIELGERLGGNPLLSHANTGNISLKDHEGLWVKISGASLADARRRGIFMRVNLLRAQACLDTGQDHWLVSGNDAAESLRPSIETPMHAVISRRAVIHLHSVNAVAWSVRGDARERLGAHLSGLPWRWIRFAPSGVPLAREIARVRGHVQVFILANHGLVVSADTCGEAEALVYEVEKRLAVPLRSGPPADLNRLKYLIDESGWRPASDERLHALATDPVSRRIVTGGVLYPCHAIFLRGPATVVDPITRVSDAVRAHMRRHGVRPDFLIFRDAGVLVHDGMDGPRREMLQALAEVAARIPDHAAVRWLTPGELSTLGGMTAAYWRQEHQAERQQMLCLTPAELNRLYNAVVADNEKRHVAIFTLVCRCGLGGAQVLDLRASDVRDLDIEPSDIETMGPWIRHLAGVPDAFFASGCRRKLSVAEMDTLMKYYGAIAGIPAQKRRWTALPAERFAATA